MRSGLWTPEYYEARLAQVGAYLDRLPGREWRSLADTAVSAPLLYEAPDQWAALRRGTDFYDEGALIWLTVNTILREQSHGQKSIEDFCRQFYGGSSGPPVVKPYVLSDIVTTLNEIVPYDWGAFFAARLTTTGAHAPLDGLTNAGWQIGYDDTPNQYVTRLETNGRVEAGYSLGLRLGTDGLVIDAIPGSPAFAAGVGPGMRLLSIGGRAWSPSALRDVLEAAEKTTTPIPLTVQNADVTSTVTVNYHGGLRIPHLVRGTGDDLLGQILEPRKK